ncbi:MAG: GNAT family N-acetyltransferase [Anaerolineales bacterium]|nr:GNAT family N-acetyltransferase [Anaerolineales bacterium]
MPPRYHWRAATAADLPALHATLAAAAAEDREPPPPLADLERQLADSWAPPATHTRLALAPDGTLAAYGRLAADPGGAGAARAYLSDAVHPLHRGEGLGDALLDWLEQRGREVLAGRPAPRTLNAHTPDHLTGRVAAYRRHGFRPSFTLLAQRRSLHLPLPQAAPLPAGLRVSAYQPPFDEALRQAQNEVFAEDPLQDQISPEDWRAYFIEHSAARLDLTYAVLGGAQVAAYLTTRVHAEANTRSGWATAWVHTLGTRAPWRGRGLARYLMVTALAAYRAAGFDTATLQVESENPIARGLYARLGFVTFERSTEYIKLI